MRFILFTDKKLPDCVSALNERLQAPATASRPGLDGWIEKKGGFALAIDSPVLGRFVRQTRLEAHIEREGNVTVIRGQVPGGASPTQQRLVLGGIAVLSLFMLLQGQAVLAVIVALAGTVLYIPLRGDYENSERLLMEVERVLKATPKPPKGVPSSVLSKPMPATLTRRPPPKPTKAASRAGKPAAVRTASRATAKPVAVRPKAGAKSAPARPGAARPAPKKAASSPPKR